MEVSSTRGETLSSLKIEVVCECAAGPELATADLAFIKYIHTGVDTH